MSAIDIVNRRGNLDEETIRQELDGNICRCTGYHNIVKAIAAGAEAMGGKSAPEPRARPPSKRLRPRHPARAFLMHDAPARGAVRGGNTMSATGIGARTPQGRPPLHHRPGPLYRRHQPARPGPCLFPALAACPCHHQVDRRQGGCQDAGRARHLHRRRSHCRQDRRADLRLDDPQQGRLADARRRRIRRWRRARSAMSATMSA
jgi:hypothetical protein